MAGTPSTCTVALLKIGGPTCFANDAYVALVEEKIIPMARHIVAVVGAVTVGVVVVVVPVVMAKGTIGVAVAEKMMTSTPDIATKSG